MINKVVSLSSDPKLTFGQEKTLVETIFYIYGGFIFSCLISSKILYPELSTISLDKLITVSLPPLQN